MFVEPQIGVVQYPLETQIHSRCELGEILLRRQRIRHGCRERLGLAFGLLPREAGFAQPAGLRESVNGDGRDDTFFPPPSFVNASDAMIRGLSSPRA